MPLALGGGGYGTVQYDEKQNATATSNAVQE